MRGGAGTGVEGTAEAIVSLFGRTATLVVPTGRDNVADLLEIFVKLDTSLSELKQENKVLKETVARHEAEIGRLQLRSGMPQLLQVGADAGSGEFEAKVEAELGGLRSAMKKSEETTSAEFERLDGELAALSNGWLQLEERVAEQEQRPVYSPPPPPASPPPAQLPVQPIAPPVEKELPVVVVEQQTMSADGEELMGRLEQKLEQRLASEVAGLSSLLAAPLSVAFDAVRSEDFLGQDGWLPFTKLNANLGDGMNMETGIFTVPLGGLYLFLLNVYGAPRDGVVLSIR